MKVGDLVIMPNPIDYTLRKKQGEVGLIMNDKIVRKRIGVLWADGDGDIDYEPVDWLEVISEIR